PAPEPSFRQANSRVPQRTQNTRSSRSEVAKRPVSPVTVSALCSKKARAKNGEPIAFWQLRQWQTRTLSGSPALLNPPPPQRQPPSLVMLIAISCAHVRRQAQRVPRRPLRTCRGP